MKPSIGRIVHFVQETVSAGPRQLVHLPAIITAVWGDTCVNLMVFTDGSNSEVDGLNFRCCKWVTLVTLDESATQARSWHWTEQV